MALNQVYNCPKKLSQLNKGPLAAVFDGFCDSLLHDGFAVSTVRKHLCNCGYLNDFLKDRNSVAEHPLREQEVNQFLVDYAKMVQNHRSPHYHMNSIKWSIHRLTHYLCTIKCFLHQSSKSPLYQPLLLAYLRWLKEAQGNAPSTCEVRAHSITLFLQHLGARATVEGCSHLTPKTVEDFFLSYAKDCGQGSRHSMQSALRGFLRFIVQKGYTQRSLALAVPKLRTYKLSTVVRGLSEQESMRLLTSIDQHSSTGQRDYAVCQLLYHYGVRGGQVRALLLTDVDWNKNQIVFKVLKHGKPVCLPLTHCVARGLILYLKSARPSCSDPHLFLTARPPYQPLRSSSVVSNIVRQYIIKAGIEIPHKGGHALRHGFATRMLAKGHSLKAIADVLGHRDLSNTLPYTKVDFEHLKHVPLPWPESDTL